MQETDWRKLRAWFRTADPRSPDFTNEDMMAWIFCWERLVPSIPPPRFDFKPRITYYNFPSDPAPKGRPIVTIKPTNIVVWSQALPGGGTVEMRSSVVDVVKLMRHRVSPDQEVPSDSDLLNTFLGEKGGGVSGRHVDAPLNDPDWLISPEPEDAVCHAVKKAFPGAFKE